MRGLPGFRHKPGMRRLPRPGATGGSPELVSVPRLPGRRSRCGSGHGGAIARDGSGRGVGTSVPCKVTVRDMPGRFMPVRDCNALRPAARCLQAPQGGATRCGVQPHGITGAAKRPCRRPADNSPGAPSRGAGKAAAFSRCALPPRRASVVTSAKRTVKRSERASDDAATGNRPSTQVVDVQRRNRCLDAVVRKLWSGAKWCQRETQDFLRRIHALSVIVAIGGKSERRATFWELGGCCISVPCRPKQV